MSCPRHSVAGAISGRFSCFVMCVACFVFGVVYCVFCVEATQNSMRPLKILQEKRLKRNGFFSFGVYPKKITLPGYPGLTIPRSILCVSVLGPLPSEEGRT